MFYRNGVALVAAILIQLGTSAHGSPLICEALFRPASTVTLHIFADENPHFMRGPILSKTDLEAIFKDVPRAAPLVGKTAVRHMQTKTAGLDAETKAQIWWELSAYGNRHAGGSFFSDLYVTDDGRFIYRGGAGETLFIDSDGKMYRTLTRPLDNERVWVADYAKMTLLN